MVASVRAMQPTPTIDVGGLRFGLSGLDLGLDVAVRARYARFLTEAPPEIALEIAIAGDHAHAPPEMPRVETVGDRRYHIDYGALQADVDLARGRGQATVLSTVYIVDSLLRIVTTLAALERDALLVHASGVRRRGAAGAGDQALVCFGPSGVGKTTIARSVPADEVLCDEMILLSVDALGAVTASGTPFHGDLSICAPGTLPLLQLVQLVQGEGDSLTPLSTARAARALLGSVLFFCREDALAERLLSLAVRVCQGRTSRLTFRRETHAPTFVDQRLGRAALAPGATAPPA